VSNICSLQYVIPKIQHVVYTVHTRLINKGLNLRQRYYLLYILVTQLLSACNNIMELDDSPIIFCRQIQSFKRSQLSTILRHLLLQAGYNPQLYCTHSFRIGAATTSAAAGLPPWLITTMGWWNSDAYQSNIRAPSAVLKTVPSILARTTISNDFTGNPDNY